MKYYISDLHLFHENAIKFDHRPFESVEERYIMSRNIRIYYLQKMEKFMILMEKRRLQSVGHTVRIKNTDF